MRRFARLPFEREVRKFLCMSAAHEPTPLPCALSTTGEPHASAAQSHKRSLAHHASLAEWIHPWQWGPVKRLRRSFRTWRNERFWRTPAVAATRPTDARIIVTLTTSPKRLPHLRPTLASLLNQSVPPDEIHLNVPPVFRRTGEPYVLPAWLNHCDPRIVVHRPDDIGPATKSVPTIERLSTESHAIIVVVDDDVRYLHRTLEVLVEAVTRDPSRAYGLSGYVFETDWSNRYDKRECNVEILEGWASWAVHRSALGDGLAAYFDSVRDERACFLHDDVVMSNWLALRAIPRVRLFDPRANSRLMQRHGAQLASGYEQDALHKGAGGLVQALDPRAVSAALAQRGLLALHTPERARP